VEVFAPFPRRSDAVSAGEPGREALARQVVRVVQGLVDEAGEGAPRRAVRLEDALDRDLGIGSLERVELLLRLEQALGVRLTDAAMVAVDRVADLVAAVAAARPSEPEALLAAQAALPPGRPAPAGAPPRVAGRRGRGGRDPDRIQVWLREDGGEERPITYGALWRRASAVAAGLAARGAARGDRVALMLRTEEGFLAAFFGTLLAGTVPVPLYPPVRLDRLEEYAERQTRILRNAEARLLVTFAEAERMARLLRSGVPSLATVVAVDGLGQPGGPAPAVPLGRDDPALIQYTSGSTGEPKGVLLSHANLLANIRAIGEAIAIGPEDVGVSWLPLYHDMGLIGSWLAALYFGIPIAILSPIAFLGRPSRWLWTIHAHRATVSPAPNFAYDLCARRVPDGELQGLDLSSWRLAFNGAEPVSADTIERFTRRFVPYGFRAEAMCPVYGLAEASVALTVPPLGRPCRIDRVDRARLAAGVAWPAPEAESSALRFVACGRPIPGHEVRIVDDAGQPLGERVQGRIEFRGPSITAGYFRNPEATRAARREGWWDSGDLGYRADGDLFVTGRRKDLVIKAGQNLYPQEVEEIVGEVPGIRKGCVAAFGVPDPATGTERLVVVAETRETGAVRREHLRAQAVSRVVAALGVPPDAIVLGPPGAVLKTSSGKIRRGATRDAYLDGTLGRGRGSGVGQWTRLLARDALARVRRGVGTVAGLAYTAYVGLVLGLTLPVLWALVGLAPGARQADRLVRHWCRLALALAGCRLGVEGLDRLTGVAPAVLAANHASYVDAVALLAALPDDVRFVAKRELLRTPVVGTVIRKVGHLTVERADPSRSVADAEVVSATLRRGVSLLVFPEGTFRRAPGLLPFRLGAFKAAVEGGRPVVPVAIRGTREVLPPDTWRFHRGPITVTVGAPVHPAGTGWPAMVRLRDLTQAEIARRLGEVA
jgi:fatty-acyl-CoA synthase